MNNVRILWLWHRDWDISQSKHYGFTCGPNTSFQKRQHKQHRTICTNNYRDNNLLLLRGLLFNNNIHIVTVTQRLRHITRLCCRAICFITLKYVSRLGLPWAPMFHLLHEDNLTVALVRWFEPHPTAVERCSQALPLCPGIFGINHCLWRYVRCPRSRKVLIAENGQPTKFFVQQAKMFGKTQTEQLQRLHDESHAWYDIVFPHSIDVRTHMLPEFEIHNHKFSSTWLQTVTLV